MMSHLVWSITVEGIDDGAIEFTNLDAAKLTTRKVEAVLTKKDGSEQKQNWEGVALKDVLNRWVPKIIKCDCGSSRRLFPGNIH